MEVLQTSAFTTLPAPTASNVRGSILATRWRLSKAGFAELEKMAAELEMMEFAREGLAKYGGNSIMRGTSHGPNRL